jgi:hypothetical protein
LTYTPILKGLICTLATISFCSQAQYKTLDPADENDIDAPRFWNEAEVKIPSAPPSKNLKPFFVSINTPLTFAIDADSLALGQDDVLRYILVITSPSGAKQISYEGIRCEKYEWRLYGTLTSDGQWRKNPTSKWQLIMPNSYNRYHSALVKDAFCENSIPRRDIKEIVQLLKP